MKIQNGQLVHEAGLGFEVLSAFDFWNLVHEKGIETDLRLKSLSEVTLYLSAEDERFSLRPKLRTEDGLLDLPTNFESDWDHVVIDSNWYPIDRDFTKDLFEVLSANQIFVFQTLTMESVFNLLRIRNQIGLDIDISIGLASLTSTQRSRPLPISLIGTPFKYQIDGISWLMDYVDNGLGALLGDEMGLGKTFQALGVIAHIFEKTDTKILVVCPAMLIHNWIAEFYKFLPKVVPVIHYKEDRVFSQNAFDGARVVLTTYDLVTRDFAVFDNVVWDLVVADEAQFLKNPDSQRRNAIDNIAAKSKVLVTGTPVENSLRDLWSLIDIIHPNFLGTREHFESTMTDSILLADAYARSVKPYILRRNAVEVADQLPEITYIDVPIEGSLDFANFYADYVQNARANGDSVLRTITRLTQICCHPVLVDQRYEDLNDKKIERLMGILDEIVISNDEKVLIFSTFQKSIDMLHELIRYRFGLGSVTIIDGRVETKVRQEIVDGFNSEDKGPQILILNPKAAGVGLNIIGANHVIHFNRQWNPMVEMQANKRVHRHGQKKPVFVHRLYYKDTIEELINQRQEFKIELADASLAHSLKEREEILLAQIFLITPTGE